MAAPTDTKDYALSSPGVNPITPAGVPVPGTSFAINAPVLSANFVPPTDGKIVVQLSVVTIGTPIVRETYDNFNNVAIPVGLPATIANQTQYRWESVMLAGDAWNFRMSVAMQIARLAVVFVQAVP